MQSSTRYQLENQLIDRILPVFAILTASALALGQIRAMEIGHGFRDLIQVFMFLLLIIITFYRQRLSILFKINAILIHAGVVGALGVSTLGFFAAGVFYLLLTSVVAALFFDKKLIVIIIFITILILVLDAVGFSNQLITLEGTDQLLANPATWMVYIVGFAALAIFSCFSVYMYRQAVHDLVARLEEQQGILSKQHRELQEAIAEIKVLRGIIPICSYCRKIRDDEGAWEVIEKYFSEHADVQFTHGICPSCMKEQTKDF